MGRTMCDRIHSTLTGVSWRCTARIEAAVNLSSLLPKLKLVMPGVWTRCHVISPKPGGSVALSKAGTAAGANVDLVGGLGNCQRLLMKLRSGHAPDDTSRLLLVT